MKTWLHVYGNVLAKTQDSEIGVSRVRILTAPSRAVPLVQSAGMMGGRDTTQLTGNYSCSMPVKD